MSRAYRIKVRQSLDRTLRAEDSVSTRLEILEVLPADQMAGLLAAELEAAGYQREGDALERKQDGVVIRVNPATGEVVVRAEACEEIRLEGQRESVAYDEEGESAKAVREHIQRDLQSELDKKAKAQEAVLQQGVTDQLEGRLIDLSRELDGAVNRATAEALKIRAGQLGQIKEISEDRDAGCLTIVVEV
jgi:hypothetical protein